MTEKINIKTFEHLVDLAALALSGEEAVYLRSELNNLLDAVEELAAIPLDKDLELTARGVPYTEATSPALRNDEWAPNDHPEKIVDQAPQTNSGFIVVPDIPHINLD